MTLSLRAVEGRTRLDLVSFEEEARTSALVFCDAPATRRDHPSVPPSKVTKAHQKLVEPWCSIGECFHL